MYEEADGVSIGASLAPVLANTITPECEKVIVNQLIEIKMVNFYIRHDDAIGSKTLISFSINLTASTRIKKFTIHTFENCVPHFLDIEICPNGLSIYHKNTQTDQYTNIESFTLWKWKPSWIISLTIRVEGICSRNHFNQKINLVKDYTAWNSFPKRSANSIIKRV